MAFKENIWNNFKHYNKGGSNVNIKNCTLFSMDIETFGLDARNFWFGVISWVSRTNNGEQGYYKVFKSHHDMKKFIYDLAEKASIMKTKIWFYGHNCEYDYIGVFKDNFFSDEIKYIFKPFITTIKEYTIINDLMSLYPMSLSKVGEIVGLHKTETPNEMKQEYSENPVWKEPSYKDIEYCLKDTQIVLQAIEFYKDTIEEIFGIRIKKLFTTPQVTIKTFQTWIKLNQNEFKHPLFIRNKINSSTDDFELIRYCFRGARLVAFQKGYFDKVYQIDINSLYSYIMKDTELPNFTNTMKYNSLSVEKSKKLLKYDGYMECQIRVPELDIGYLPIRYKGEQIYPKTTCVIKGIWTNFEIDKAINEHGYELISVQNMQIYERNYDKYFKSYIERLFKIKQENETFRPIAKLLMNGLFGKFAQRNENKNYLTVKRENIYDYPEWLIEGYDGEYAIISRKSSIEYPKWTQPYISAIITAKARDYLYNNLIKVSTDDLLYSDTDSIIMKNFHKYKHLFTNKELPDKTLDENSFIEEWNRLNNDMGEWKIERVGEAHIRGEKMTKIRDHNRGFKISISGVPTRYRTEENFDKGIFSIDVMNKIGSNINTPEKIGRFWKKPIELKEEQSKIDIENNFSDIVNLYYEEEYD